LAAGAETGWDYSSRWLQNGEALSTIMTPDVVPVCLNSILLRFELNMRYLYNKLEAYTKVK
jgi:alpha,alpha-trehalase